MEQEKLLRQLSEFTVIMEEKASKISKLIGRKKEPNRWLVSSDVKKMLKISESTLRRMRNRNDIPFGKIGKTYYYPSAFFDTALLKRINDDFKKTLDTQ